MLNFGPELFTTTNLLAILYLVVLEGVLSVDNALALAALVKGRLHDPEEQKKALRWGILGAYAFRIGIVFCGVWLMQHEWIKWGAAGYLIYLGASELFFKKAGHEADASEKKGFHFRMLSPLWSTILSVELMDIMFSIDSIAVALSISDKAVILIAGAMLGILAMRFAAQGFIRLLDRFPILEKTAFLLVLLAGLKIVAELRHVHVPESAFMVAMFAIILGSMLIPQNKKTMESTEG